MRKRNTKIKITLKLKTHLQLKLKDYAFSVWESTKINFIISCEIQNKLEKNKK